MKTLYKTKGKHHKVSKQIDQWLLSNCIEINNHLTLDGIGNYKEYMVFPLKNNNYCIIVSVDKINKLYQKIIQIDEQKIKYIKLHKWLQNMHEKEELTLNIKEYQQ